MEATEVQSMMNLFLNKQTTNFLFFRSKIASSTTGTPMHNTLNSHASHTFNSLSNTLYSTAHGSEYLKNSLDRSK